MPVMEGGLGVVEVCSTVLFTSRVERSGDELFPGPVVRLGFIDTGQ